MNAKSVHPLVIGMCVLGVLYVAYLISLPQDTVFFSGDSGVKYLLAKQVLRGNFSPVLELSTSPAIRQVWADGLYPFSPPFVYPHDGRWLAAFPIRFPLLSAPMLAALGWRGLYVLPALGVLLTWAILIRVGRLVQLGTGAILVMLFSILFCTPLTLYAGMFWEHTLGVCFSCIPLLLLGRESAASRNPRLSVLVGFLSGLGVFFRPESLVCVLTFLAAALLLSGKQRLRQILLVLLGVLFSTALFLASNVLLYGHVLGMHSFQVLQEASSSSSLARRWWARVGDLLSMLSFTWPSGVAVMVVVPAIWLLMRNRKREVLICLATLFLGVALVALIVPNSGGKQWGPRYLLVLVPCGTLLLGFLVQAIAQFKYSWMRIVAYLGIAVCLVVGCWVNVWNGTRFLKMDYDTRILPALQVIRAQPQRFVVVTHQWTAQEMAVLFEEKVFLWIRQPEDLYRAAEHLHAMQVPEALLICYHASLPPGAASARVVWESRIYTVRILDIETLVLRACGP